MTKGQTTIYKTLHRKRRSSNTNPTKNGDELRCSGRVSSSCFTRDTRSVTVKRHEHHMTWKSCWASIRTKTVKTCSQSVGHVNTYKNCENLFSISWISCYPTLLLLLIFLGSQILPNSIGLSFYFHPLMSIMCIVLYVCFTLIYVSGRPK